MSFQGWPEEALDFYEGLELDNSKAFWIAHKHIYDSAVLGPMIELTEELTGRFGEVKIFRPYRDVRFSADKTPYKTAIGATVGSGYVQLSANGLAAGNGMYHLAPDQLDRYRRAVADDGAGVGLAALAAAISARGIDVHGTDALKSAPRGYPADHPRIELLRYKGLIGWQSWPVETWLATPAAKDRVIEFLETTRPLAEWLDAQVGPSELEHAGRR